MTLEVSERDLKLPKGLINHYSSNIFMDVRMRKSSPTHTMNEMKERDYQNGRDYQRSYSQAKVRKPFRMSYFSLESLVLLVCLTVSLVILPLILPPLPPPPFMLLLLPIGILGVLMILAFMPSNVKDITYNYM